MSKQIVTTIFLLLLPVICLSGVWQNYNTEAPDGTIYYHDGYLWSISGCSIWRYDTTKDVYELINPSDWMESGGKIIDHIISRDGSQWFFIDMVGLAKFDGINWQLYDLEFKYFGQGIAEDSDGRIWLAVEGGLAYLENDQWFSVNEINGLSFSNRYGKMISNDNKGNLWLLFRSDTGDNSDPVYNLASKTGDIWTIYPFPEDYDYFELESAFFADSIGGVWFTAEISGTYFIVRFHDGVFTSFPDTPGNILKSISEDSDGVIWLSPSGNILFEFKNNSLIKFDTRPLYPELDYNAWVHAIVALPDASVWIFIDDCTDTSSPIPIGFTIIRDGVLSRHDVNFNYFPLSSNNLISLRGKHGTLTGFQNNSPIYEFNNIDNLSDYKTIEITHTSIGTCSDLFIDSSDRIWRATGKDFISVDNGVPTYYNKESWWPKGDMTKYDRAAAVSQEIDGTIWAALGKHLYYFKDDVWTEASMTNYQAPWAMAVDTSGVIWMAHGLYGFSKYDGVDRYMVNVPPMVNDVSADSKGGVWVASSSNSPSEGGLYYVNGESITRFTEQNGLPSKYIKKVAVDSNDAVWFAFKDYYENDTGGITTTSGGVCHFDGSNVEVYRPEDGLASHNVNDIAVSSEGIVWFATDAGLSTFDINAVPDPKIRTGVNKYNLKAGDEFKLGINLQNRGPQRTVKLVTALLVNSASKSEIYDVGARR